VTLDRVDCRQPDRLSIYNYAHMPTLFKPQRRIHEEICPHPGEAGYFESGSKQADGCRLCVYRHGSLRQAEDELAVAQRQGRLHRNFQGYSTHSDCDLVALACSGHRKIGPTYSQNYRDLDSYYDALDHDQLPIMRRMELNADDLVRRAIIQL